ncbi:TPA: hypothetical protein HA234_01350 [Candidatus Woesearchaeota archaeon]|nr:hypothetical protein [Candidatus Woesearchaeota archaeon]
MTKFISIHEAAEIEINEAADFYDRESLGLGSAFLDEIEKAIERISLLPELAPKRAKSERSAFPSFHIH